MNHQHRRRLPNQSDDPEILGQVVRQFALCGQVSGKRARGDQQGLTVGFGFRDKLSADVATRKKPALLLQTHPASRLLQHVNA